MALHLHGVTVEVAHTGAEALRAVQSFRPHLVVLDVMLPDLDGFSVLEQMGRDRRSADIPVLFLTARGGLDDRLRGLALGGDDYMTKPFSVEEMLLRINAILRRTEGYERPPTSRWATSSSTRRATRCGGDRTVIELTPTEFRLLHYLMVNAGHVVSKAQIRDQVWDYSFDGKVNMVEVYVSYLRKKLDVHGPPLIRTVRGVGYCMRAAPEVQRPGHRGGPTVTLRLRLLLLGVGIVAAGLVISDVVTYNALRRSSPPGWTSSSRWPPSRWAGPCSRRRDWAPRWPGPAPRRRFTHRIPAPGTPRRPGSATAAGSSGQSGASARVLVPPGTYGVLRGATGKVEAHLFFSYGGKVPKRTEDAGEAPGIGADRPGRPLLHDPSGPGSFLRGVGQAPGRRQRRGRHRRAPDRPGQHAAQLLLIEVVVSALLLIGLGIVTWVMVRRDLRPLEEIASTAGAIAEGDLSQRVSHVAEGPRSASWAWPSTP